MGSDISPHIKVSVRLMTYQHAKFIEEALKGIDMQEVQFPFELVIGDDFSTDGTLDKVKSYPFRNPNLSVQILQREEGDAYSLERKKKGRLFNFADILHHCRGEYIALLDGDDYWTDTSKLQKQVEFLDKSPGYAGCFHNTDVIDEVQGDKVGKPWRVYEKNTFSLTDTIATRSLLHTSAFLFKNDLLEIPSWFYKIQSGDMAIFALVASKGKLHRIDESMSVYRKNTTGITTTIDYDSYHKNRIILLQYFKESFEPHVSEKIEEVITYHKTHLQKEQPKGWLQRLKSRLG